MAAQGGDSRRGAGKPSATASAETAPREAARTGEPRASRAGAKKTAPANGTPSEKSTNVRSGKKRTNVRAQKEAAPAAEKETNVRAFSGADAPPSTEAIHPWSHALDRLPVEDVVALLVDEEERSWRAARRARPAIARAAQLVADQLAEGGRIIYVGAGTSGRLGALDAAELPPTFGLAPSRAIAIVAGGQRALAEAVEGAEDRPADAKRALLRIAVDERDVVCAIAASGMTPFTRAALEEAAEWGAARIFVTSSRVAAREVARAGVTVILLDTGPELIAGSTRLKSATATKLALNAMTTAAMVRLGKVWRGRMIGLVATNDKLRARARRIVVDLGRVDEARADKLLDNARGDVKVALAAALLGVPVSEAARRLAAAGDQLANLLRGSNR